MTDTPATDAQTNDRGGEELWRLATKTVKNAVTTSVAFKTLRCRAGDAYIPESRLTKVKQLGKGAFAVVDQCLYDTGDGRVGPVAVKRLKPEIFANEEDVKLFLEEAKLLKRFMHSCIVDFLGVGYTSNDEASLKKEGGNCDGNMQESLYLVQEFMSYGTLKSLVLKQMYLHRKRLYTNRQALEWFLQMAKGLRYLHSSKPIVIHRDMKMENVLMKKMEDGAIVVKLSDFGLSTAVDPRGNMIKMNDSSKNLNECGSTLRSQSSRAESYSAANASYDLSGRTGSLMYMAPEVLRCEHYNEKCDIFALGVIYYEVFMRTVLLTFVSCVGDPSEIENYARSVANGARPSFPGGFPDGLKTLIQQCWDGDMSKRPSANEVVKTLEVLMSDPECITDSTAGPTCSCCSIQ